MQKMHMVELTTSIVKPIIEQYAKHHVIHDGDAIPIQIDGYQRDCNFTLLNHHRRFQITIDGLINDNIISPAYIFQMVIRDNHHIDHP